MSLLLSYQARRHAGIFFVIYFVYFAIPRHFIRFSLPIASLVTQSAFTVLSHDLP